MFSRQITFTAIAPPASLTRYIHSFWIVTSDGVPGSGTVFRPITDGCPGLLIRAHDELFYDHEQKQLPAFCLYGQTIRAREIHAKGRFEAVGVSFRPWAIPSLFGLSADELTDSCIDLSAVLSSSHLSEELVNELTPTQQIDRLVTCLQMLVAGSVLPDYQIDHALHELLRTNGKVPLRDLQQQLNVSERGLERKFRRHVGVSPKLFARICQFQASLAQLRMRDYGRLSDIAFDNGYADQSHFIRSFQEFAGCTPDHYRKRAGEAIGLLV